MGKASTKENKNIYQIAREEMRDENGKPWSRETAAQKIADIENGKYYYLDKYRLVKIEDETVKIQPDDVIALSMAYKKPALRNYYCCHQHIFHWAGTCAPTSRKYTLDYFALPYLFSFFVFREPQNFSVFTI